MSKYQKELQIAADLVNKASEVTEWFRESGFRIIEKKDSSPVTLADYAGQIFINHQLKKLFPSDQIIAEENIEELTGRQEEMIRNCFQDLNIPIKNFKSTLNYRGTPSNRQWTVDPVDGTKGFIENLSYSIGIGFMVDSEPKVSAIASPNYYKKKLGVFRAELGKGAEISLAGKEFTPISVSSHSDLQSAKVCISLHNVSKATLNFLDEVGIGKKNRLPMDGMGKFCKVAEGSYDFYIHLKRNVMYSWDFCPGELLVREAGGISSDIKGNRLQFKDRNCVITAPGYLFSNKELAQSIYSILK